MNVRPQFALSVGIGAVLLLAAEACQKSSARDYRPEFSATASAPSNIPEYRFGVQPMHTSRRLIERYGGLLDALNASAAGFHLKLVSAQTEASYDARLRRSEFDLCIIEPHRILDAEPLGYRTIARSGARDRIAGVIIVRRDSGITRVSDLKGKTIAFPSPTALASTMLVRMFLWEAGFHPDALATSKYVGTQESALREVATGDADAAGVSRDGWLQYVDEDPDLADRLTPKWTTEELPGAAVMVRGQLPPEHVRELQRAFVQLKNCTAGRLALERAGFREFRYGEDASYDELWEFLGNYGRVFRMKPQPSGTP